MIQVNEDFLGFRDKRYWSHGYILISKEVEDCVPVFLKHLANEIYICGKTINLLKLCCPKDLQTKIAKQELIVQAHETAEKVLEIFKDRQLSEKMAHDTKKRELFQKLKKQFEKEQERRLTAKQEEAEDDFSYARDLTEREKRLKALEEELESSARQELIAHYSRLSEDATRKEQRALWKLQRQKLETARRNFFMEDEKHIETLLTQFPVDQCRARLDIVPQAETPHSAQVALRAPLGDERLELPTTEPQPSDTNINDEESQAESLTYINQTLSLHTQADATTLYSGSTNAESNVSSTLVMPVEANLCTPDVDIADFLPTSSSKEQHVELSVDQSKVDDALKDIGSDLTKATEIRESQPASKTEMEEAFTQVSQGHIQIGENVSDVQPTRPRWNIHGHVSDASIKIGDYVPNVKVSPPHPSQHGHASVSHIKVGEYMSDVEPGRPRWNLHGHVSTGHIQVGEYASDVDPSRPSQNIHGHASQANIKIGENVSDVRPSRPRWNVHGHASDANIKIGENVSDVVSLQPQCNVHGHASQSNIQIGGHVSDVELSKPHCSTFGHPSQSSIQIRDWSPKECDVKQIKKSEFGHSSDSTKAASACEEGASGDHASSLVCPSGAHHRAADREEDVRTADDAWVKEQDYLRALADKYCLEKYQDSYELMSEPPLLHLLSHVMPRQFSFPMDPDIQSATDESAVQLIELLSLPVLMKYSVTAPMVSHVSLVNKAIVDYYFVELTMEKHFKALRHFLLMEDGEFAQSLSDLLFEKLGSGQTPSELLTPLVLNSILSKALQYSLHGDSPLASNLSFALKYFPEMFTPTAPDALSCLELKYKVDWPLNIVITETCMNKYNKIFSFLLQLKHMVWTLGDVWFHLKRTALVNKASNSVQYRQLQLYRHEMQHFVKVIQGYIANQILHVTWCEFRNKLSAVSNLEEIHRTHAEYLNKALFRGLLTEKAAPVMKIIHSIFSLILKFRIQLISQPWTCDAGKQTAIHPNFVLMQQSYNTFKYYSDFLFEVVTKLVNRGYQPHLEDFLLRINFNSYYKES
ncbi:hypothetical protein FKM82_012751 [Ascaphus truei]